MKASVRPEMLRFHDVTHDVSNNHMFGVLWSCFPNMPLKMGFSWFL